MSDDGRIIHPEQGAPIHADGTPVAPPPTPPPPAASDIPPESVLLNRRKPVAVYSILAVMLVGFLAQNAVGAWYVWQVEPSALLETFLDWPSLGFPLYVLGAKYGPLVAEGQVWRLLSCVFLHADWMHLLMNGFSLYIWGRYIELLFGRWKTWALFLLAGLGGSLLSFAGAPGWALGASGGIFGLFGTLLYFRKRRPMIFKRAFGPQVFILVAINLVYGFTGTAIDNFGHIGGLITGYLAAWALGLYREKSRAWWAWAALAVWAVGCFCVGWFRWRGVSL